MLGAKLYFDKNLSEPDGQACASCHQPFAGYADPVDGQPVSEGVMGGLFGGRNAPSAAYMGKSPVLGVDAAGVWTGGAFWDGRASGWTDGKPLIEQAKGPFLNPVEMNNGGPADVIADVKASSYARLFKAVYGPHAFADVDLAYHNTADAIAAFESSRLVNTYSSRFDAYTAGLRWVLTAKEKRGLALFNDKGQCNLCHPSTGVPSGKALFTDFSYDNLGLPVNPEIAALQGHAADTDLGLGGFLAGTRPTTPVWPPTSNGAFKVPTLRNVAKTAPYGHNGVFGVSGGDRPLLQHARRRRRGMERRPLGRSRGAGDGERDRTRQARSQPRGGSGHRRVPQDSQRHHRIQALTQTGTGEGAAAPVR